MSFGIYMNDLNGKFMKKAWKVPSHYTRKAQMQAVLQRFYEEQKAEIPADCICLFIANTTTMKQVTDLIYTQTHWRNGWALLPDGDGNPSTSYLGSRGME